MNLVLSWFDFADGVTLGFAWLGISAVIFNVISYRRINAKRAKVLEGGEDGTKVELSGEEVRRLGDKSPTFRYNL